MIKDSELVLVGRINKPHGISGELSVTPEIDLDFSTLCCVVVKIDNINVPFFVESERPKSVENVLLTIDGISDEKEAAALANHDLYALASEVADIAGDSVGDDGDPEGFYAGDLVGFAVVDATGALLGTIDGVDDSTDNVLFEIARPGGGTLLVPVADDFISDIDTGAKLVVMDLPQGLLDLN